MPKHKSLKWIFLIGTVIMTLCLVYVIYINFQMHKPFPDENRIVLSPDDMKHDLDQMKADVIGTYPSAEADGIDLESFFDVTYKQIKKPMTKAAFSVLLAEKVAQLKDGHSSVITVNDGPTLPIVFKIIDDHFYVLNGYKSLGTGCEVISIAGVSIKDIYEAYAKEFSTENVFWVQELFEERYVEVNRVLALGGKKTYENGVQIAYLENGNLKSTILYERDFISNHYNDAVRNSILYDLKKDPIGVISDNEAFKYAINEDLEYMYYKIMYCHYDQVYTQFTDEVVQKMIEEELTTIVIDLRGNWGGTTQVIDYFMTRLDAYYRDLIRTSGIENKRINMFVLTDHRTFSGGVSFALSMKDNYDATLIGQPTGGAISANGNVKRFELENSGINYAISSITYPQYDRSDENLKTLLPDIVSSYDINDYVYGTDKDMEIVENLLEIEKENALNPEREVIKLVKLYLEGDIDAAKEMINEQLPYDMVGIGPACTKFLNTIFQDGEAIRVEFDSDSKETFSIYDEEGHVFDGANFESDGKRTYVSIFMVAGLMEQKVSDFVGALKNENIESLKRVMSEIETTPTDEEARMVLNLYKEVYDVSTLSYAFEKAVGNAFDYKIMGSKDGVKVEETLQVSFDSWWITIIDYKGRTVWLYD